MLIDPHNSALLVIDVQQRLLPAVQSCDAVEQSVCDLVEIAAKLGVPTLYSEQYPKGLGPTSEQVLAALPATATRLEKVAFSCVQECAEEILKTAPDQVVICGMETHVCVLQTAIELKERGLEVFVIADAVSSRSELDKTLGLERMRQYGIEIVSKEMVFFEWLQRAGTEQFRSISKRYLR